ncbi:MAG: polysaccharide biosynthesis protein PslG [Actinomycetota bacterium]|nr:polysaccharide biosynthesis protein PslG [Actinomycetota bacterium]
MHRYLLQLLAVVLAVSVAGCSATSDNGSDSGKASPKPSASPSPSNVNEAIEPTFFGVHDHDPVGDTAAGWPDAPVGSLRAWDAGVTWRDLEPAPGVFNFSRLDAMVDTAESHDSDVLLVLGQTPAFHAKNPNATAFYGAGASSAPKLKAWKTYVRKVAKRYAGRPVILQVWNEANVSGFWSAGPQEMATLTKAAYDVLANIKPRPTLVSPALVTRLATQQKWLNDFYAITVDGQPIANYVDVVSLQLYPLPDGTPASSMELLSQMRKALTSHGVGVDKPIWNTEINYGLTGKPVDPAPKAEQIMNVVATYLLNAANGISRVYWYGWDQQQIVNTLLVQPDLATRTPAGDAFVRMRKWMLGAKVTSCKTDANGTYACTLEGPKGTSTVFWNPEGKTSVTVPDGATTAQEIDKAKQPVTAGSPLTVGRIPVMVSSAT